MPLLDESGLQRARVAPSFAVELMWALEAGVDPSHREVSPVYAEIYRDEALLRRVGALYDDTVGCFPDVVVLAGLGGVLERTDVAATIAGIERAIERRPGTLRLASEQEDDRQSIHARLASLYDDHYQRGRYLTLVGDVAAALEPAWLADGRAEREAKRLAAEIEAGLSWRRLLERECPKISRSVDDLGSRFEPESVLVVPSAFARPGAALLLDLPGVLVAGVSALRADPRDDRSHGELARRMKALADPTRLALLVRLSKESSTVGALARELFLSQPTVSNHVKLLRDAGLVVETTRAARRRELAVDRVALESLLGDLRAAVATNDQL